MNEVILIVDEDGTINGEFNTRQTAEGHADEVKNAEEYIGVCEGELAGTQGNLTCTFSQQFFVYCSDCGPPAHPKNHSEVSFEIFLSDNNMIGTRLDNWSTEFTTVTEDCFSFELSK
jgi:hypothetical protein